MKTLPIALALMLATVTVAQAQQIPNQTRVIKFFNNATKEQIGTATVYGNTVYLRDRDGIHYATMVRNADGTRTLYDPSGNILEKDSLNLPKLPE